MHIKKEFIMTPEMRAYERTPGLFAAYEEHRKMTEVGDEIRQKIHFQKTHIEKQAPDGSKEYDHYVQEIVVFSKKDWEFFKTALTAQKIFISPSYITQLLNDLENL